MKLYTFEINQQQRVGAELGGQLVDLSAAYDAYVSAQAEPPTLRAIPAEMSSIIRLGSVALEAARHALNHVRNRPSPPNAPHPVYPLASANILAPLKPGKILCSGINYRGHKEENPEAKMPSEPFFFSKLPSAVIGPGEPIVKPKTTEQLDYEVEFAVVIGKRMKAVPESDVMDAIFGYTILHDVSARDVQFKDNQITLGKNFDTFCPLGPCIVTKDELPEPGNVRLRSLVNGTVMQNSSTAEWIFPLPRLLNFLSGVMTLEPGDVVSTGTPAGVGVFRKPPVYLQAGDTVSLEIEGIGRLENPVVAEG